jgi:hypothetical protein
MWLMLCVEQMTKMVMVMVMVGQHHWPALLAPLVMMVMVMVSQHHWPALLRPLASSTGHHQWSAPLARTPGSMLQTRR